MLSGARVNESGRSMVEMLGVLAIIGVLSVGGIAGYSKAMSKFKLTKAQDQITMTLMNVRTAFASSPTYSGLNNEAAATYHLVSSDMIVDNDTLTGAFGGSVNISSCKDAAGCSCGNDMVPQGSEAGYFCISMANLTKDACSSLATSDWGADGLIGMIVNNTPYESSELPLDFSKLVVEGNDVCADNVTITWIYY